MAESQRLSTKQANRYLVVVLIAAAILRIGLAVYAGDATKNLPGGTFDEISYDLLAHRVLAGYGFSFPTDWYPWVKANTPTSYYSSTIVLYLAGIYAIAGYHPLAARIVTALLSTLACYLLYRLGRRLFSPRVGLIAAVLGAGYAYLVLFGVALMTETPFIVALLFALDLAHELVEKPTLGKWIGLGVALAFTILLRMAILPFVVVLLGWVCWRSQVRPRMVHLGIPLVIIGLALLPWTIRNYRLYGRFMLLESQFGHIFWNANHLSHGSRFSDADWVAPLPDDIRDLNEADKTYTLLQRGIQNVRADPVRYIRLCISRIPVFFTFWPTAESSTLSNVARVLSFGILLPFMVCGLILSVRQWRRYSLIYFFAIFHSGIHLASWAMIRYRLPIDAVLLPFAAAAIAQIWDFFVQQYRSNLRVPPAGPDRKSHQVEQPLP